MRNRHMMALLLGVAPIVALGQLATAQPTTNATTNHQGMDHVANNTADAAAPANTAAEVPIPTGATEPGNMSDDAPPG